MKSIEIDYSKTRRYSLKELISFYSSSSEIVGSIEKVDVLNKLIVYAGFQISGLPHLGTYLSIKRAESFLNLSDKEVSVILLAADLHSFINKKDVFNSQETFYNFINTYKDHRSNLITGFLKDNDSELSGFQQLQSYWNWVFKIKKRVPLKRLQRCLQLENKKNMNYEDSAILYVILQVVDMIVLGVDIAIGGTDQRKIHMLYKDIISKYFKSEDLKDILFIHHDILCDKEGIKISKSKNNYKSCYEIFNNSDLYNLQKEYLLKNLPYDL